MRHLFQTLALCSLIGCSAPQGELQVHGALRSMFHQGQTGTMVTLDKLLPNPNLYAVGALTELSGEITILGGTAYLSYPEDDRTARTEALTESSAGATLLVSTEVREWVHTTTQQTIAFADLDEAIVKLAFGAGFAREDRFPFLLEGDFESLAWHVIDGTRLTSGGTSHEDHLAASVQDRREFAPAKIIGFYSPRDQTIFTHHDSTTHMHCVLDGPLATGHVDHVVVPAGTLVSFPSNWR